MAAGILDHFAGQSDQVDALGFLATFAAREVEILVQHGFHLVEITPRIGGLVSLRHQGELQFEPGQRGAQVMADAGEQGGALFEMAFQPGPHFQEGMGGLAHFGGTGRAEMGDILAAAELFGRIGEAADRFDLIADEDDRDRGQKRRRADDPKQKDMPGRGKDPVARRDEAQHAAFNLDTDIDIAGIAGGIEPDRVVELL